MHLASFRRSNKYAARVEEIAAQGKEKLLKAGVPEKNVVFEVQPSLKGMARDIVVELASGDYGVLLMGREGSKDISKFELGSIALKVLENAGACIVCLVD